MVGRSDRYADMKLETIYQAVEKAGYSKAEIIEQNRSQPLALVRQIAVWLAREGRTYTELAREFDRNHAACIHSVRVVNEKLSYKDEALIDLMSAMGVGEAK